MSLALRDTATIGIEALNAIASETTMAADWLKPRLERLIEAREPVGQTELMIVDPVVKLLCTAALPASLTAEGCRAEEETAASEHH